MKARFALVYLNGNSHRPLRLRVLVFPGARPEIEANLQVTLALINLGNCFDRSPRQPVAKSSVPGPSGSESLPDATILAAECLDPRTYLVYSFSADWADKFCDLQDNRITFDESFGAFTGMVFYPAGRNIPEIDVRMAFGCGWLRSE